MVEGEWRSFATRCVLDWFRRECLVGPMKKTKTASTVSTTSSSSAAAATAAVQNTN